MKERKSSNQRCAHTLTCTNSSEFSFLARYCEMLSTALWPNFGPRMYGPTRRNSRRFTIVPGEGDWMTSHGAVFFRIGKFSVVLLSNLFRFVSVASSKCSFRFDAPSWTDDMVLRSDVLMKFYKFISNLFQKHFATSTNWKYILRDTLIHFILIDVCYHWMDVG